MFDTILKTTIELTNEKINNYSFCEQTVEWANEVIEFCDSTNELLRKWVNQVESANDNAQYLIEKAEEVKENLFKLKDSARLYLHKNKGEANEIDPALKELAKQILSQEKDEREVEQKAANVTDAIDCIFDRLNESKTLSLTDILNVNDKLNELPEDYRKDIKNVAHFTSLVELANNLLLLNEKAHSNNKLDNQLELQLDKVDSLAPSQMEPQALSSEIESDIATITTVENEVEEEEEDYYDKSTELTSKIADVLSKSENSKQINTNEILALDEQVQNLPSEYQKLIYDIDKFNDLVNMVKKLNSLEK